jgi:alpha-glucosidase
VLPAGGPENPQWTGGAGAGFTTGEPWLPIGEDAGRVNVEAEQGDEGSMLAFYRRLLELRRAEPALQTGVYVPAGQKRNLFAFLRELGDDCFLIAVNLGSTRARLTVPRHLDVTGKVVLATDPTRVGAEISQYINLEANEGLIARVKPCD